MKLENATSFIIMAIILIILGIFDWQTPLILIASTIIFIFVGDLIALFYKWLGVE